MARSPGTKTTAAKAADKATEIRRLALDSFMTVLARKPFERIGLGEVAAEAGLSLADLRAAFGSTFDMLAGFLREVDRQVLAASGDDMEGEPARDRLFDVLMRRLDVLAPHKEAIRSLAESARRNPFFALALNKLSVRSQQWMLAAARIDSAGLRGAVRAQGLALVFARTLRTFLSDDDPALARTMATLDRELTRGERALGLVEGAVCMATRGRRGRRAPATEAQTSPDAPAVA